MTTEDPSWFVTKKGRTLRVALALALILAAVGVTATDTLRLCSVATVEGATPSVTTTCAAPGLNTALALAFTALVLAFVWPDLHELTIFGVTLKRMVAEVEEKVGQVKADTESIAATSAKLDESTAATLALVRPLEGSLAALQGRLTDLDASLDALSVETRLDTRWAAQDSRALIDLAARLTGIDGSEQPQGPDGDRQSLRSGVFRWADIILSAPAASTLGSRSHDADLIIGLIGLLIRAILAGYAPDPREAAAADALVEWLR